MPDLQFENLYGRADGKLICGIDEVGRGPLAGPVMAAAVLWPTQGIPSEIIQHLDDSKKLTVKRREKLFPLLTSCCPFGIAEASVAEIDRFNILHATFLAMERAVKQLEEKIGTKVDVALIDGNRKPSLKCSMQTIVKGDSKSLSIAAASVIAKVTRDRFMTVLSQEFKGYGWEKNAGYGTADHMKALRELGPTVCHRKSFAPVAELMAKAG
jgi:ribonuclease HII